MSLYQSNDRIIGWCLLGMGSLSMLFAVNEGDSGAGYWRGLGGGGIAAVIGLFILARKR